MSVIEAVRFTFSHQDWKHNLLLGSLFWLIPIVGPLALMGWHVEIHQRLVRSHGRPVPKIDFADFGQLLSRGLVPFVVNLLIVMPPAVVLMVVLGAAGVVAGAWSESEPTLALVVFGVGGLLCSVLLLLVTLAGHAALTRAELSEEIGASLSPRTILTYLGRCWGTMLLAVFLHGLLALVLGLAGYALCFIGIYPAVHVSSLSMVHLRWQLLGKYLRSGGPPIPVKPPVVLASEQVFNRRA